MGKLSVKDGDLVLVKEGDLVLLRRGSGITWEEKLVHVKKVTPTGRIRVEDCEYQFSPYGMRLGGDAWSSAKLSLPTEEDIKRVRENEVKQKAYKMLREVKELSYDTAVKIIAILEEEK